MSAIYFFPSLNPLSNNPTKWSDTLKQLSTVADETNCLNVFDHFVGVGAYRVNNNKFRIPSSTCQMKTQRPI